MEHNCEAVREANVSFYRAFEMLDIKRMEDIWSKGDYIKCIHPGWPVCAGWVEVRDSWVLIFNHTRAIKFSIDLLDIRILGDWAYVVCMESISTQEQEAWVDGKVLATNLFEWRGGQWQVFHHHGSPLVTNEAPAA